LIQYIYILNIVEFLPTARLAKKYAALAKIIKLKGKINYV